MGANIRPPVHRGLLLVVLVMTAIGGTIRLGSPARLGLVHFDEGIYALAGLWPFSPKGFWGIDPTVIAYAPGGYPFLVGLGSLVLGGGDLTPILVSILMGTLTIPAAAWLSWRTFGPIAGALTAFIAAFSGFHIAFSRMALTDASFLFFFILALGLGQRFLERPNVWNTIGLGLSIGLLQWFKYHGWLAGAIVALTAVVMAIRDPDERRPKRLVAVWGQGACAGLIAFVVFWPWFSFVESHGGYASLLRHHASYMQGPGAWVMNLQSQLHQASVLDRGGERWAITLIVPFLLPWRSSKVLLIAVWWSVFSVITPFYHPYARLWLPLEACSWILISAWFVWFILTAILWSQGSLTRTQRTRFWLGMIGPLTVGFVVVLVRDDGRFRIPTKMPAATPSDSLRIACRQVQADLPKDLARLRFLGRPPITFYLATAGVPLAPQPDLNALLAPGNPTDWALVDDALLRQDPDYAKAKARLTEGWDVMGQYQTTLNLPTLLDLNPGIARGTIEAAAFDCPLWLMRPRPQGAH